MRRKQLGVVGAILGLAFVQGCGGGSDGPTPPSSVVGDPPVAGSPPTTGNPPSPCQGEGCKPEPSPPGEKLGISPDYRGIWAWDNAGGDGGGVGGGGGDGGGVGSGGADGRIAQAQVTATRDDGVSLGPGLTNEKGLVTIKAGVTYRGGLKVELTGVPGSVYFDEAKKVELPFTEGQKLRAQVDGIRNNIGITPLTEAAVLYSEDPSFTENPDFTKLTPAERIKAANDRVLAQVNSQLPDKYTLTDDITRLPVLVGPQTLTSQNEINTLNPETPEGRYGAILAGLSITANQFNPSLKTPGFDIGRQIARDLTDGKLDGVGPGGREIAPSEQLAYSMDSLSSQLTAAIETANVQFGPANTPAPTPVKVSQGSYSLNNEDSLQANLLSNGTVVSGDRVLSLGGSTARASAVFSDGVAMFIRRADATMEVLGSNNASFRRFGMTTSESSSDPIAAPSDLAGANGATEIRFGENHAVARRVDGSVLVWGSNRAGQMSVDSSPTPVPLKLSAKVRSVAAGDAYSMALTDAGRVLSWGSTSVAGQGPITSPTKPPGEVKTDANTALTDVISITGTKEVAFAVKRDGTVWGWGTEGRLRLRGGGEFATRMADLANIRKVTAAEDGMVALDNDGVVRRWAQFIAPSTIPEIKFKVRDIQGFNSGPRNYGTIAIGVGGEEATVSVRNPVVE